MPRIRRSNLPPALLDHLADRVRLRPIAADDLIALRDWLGTNSEVPVGDWFMEDVPFRPCGASPVQARFLVWPKSR